MYRAIFSLIYIYIQSIIEPLTPNGYVAYREFVQLLLRLAGMWSMGCSPVSFARFLDSIFGKFLEINMQSNRKENALVSNSMDEESATQEDLIGAQDSQNPTNIMEPSNSEDRALSFHDGSSSSDVIHRIPSATITSPLRSLRPRTREHFLRPGSSIVMSNAIPKRPQSTPSRLYVSKVCFFCPRFFLTLNLLSHYFVAENCLVNVTLVLPFYVRVRLSLSLRNFFYGYFSESPSCFFLSWSFW